MAFVLPAAANLRLSTFTQSSVDTKPRRASILCDESRMVTQAEGGPRQYGKAGKSMWKEDPFRGGFPGGEPALLDWISGGMKDEVPDVPEVLQPTSAFKPSPEADRGILGKLDKLEFFKKTFRKFIGGPSVDIDISGPPDTSDSTDEGNELSVKPVDPVPAPVTPNEDSAPGALSTEVPDESLYEMYYPKDTRFLAPDITIEYDEKSEMYKRVGMAMSEVTASVTDVYYPKETKNFAPVINVFYRGSLATASVSIAFDEIDPLPTLPPPAKDGAAVTTLVPGRGEGLQLNYDIAGGEHIPL